MNTRMILSLSILGAAAAGFLLLRTSAVSTIPAPPVDVPLTIAQAGDFYLYAPLYVAQDQGFFQKHHAKVSIVSTGGDDKTWAAVLSGSAQFGLADPTFIAIAGQRGQPGKIVATIVNGVPFWGITKKDIPSITSPAQLKGHMVATFPSPSTAYVLQRQMFTHAGLTPSIREGGFGTLLALLEANQADIALELEPNVSQALTKGYHIVYSMADANGDFTITGLTTTPTYIRDHRDNVRSVVESLADAMTYLHTYPEQGVDILVKRFPEINRDVAAAALKRVLTANIVPRTPIVAKDAWLKALQLRVEAGDLAALADPMTFVDNSFAK